MDYYNFNSGFADFRNPPHQENNLQPRVFVPKFPGTEGVKYMRAPPRNQDCRKASSASLVLRKTNVKEVAEHYGNESVRYRPYPQPKLTKPNLPKHRPLIRVAIIPNNTGTQTKQRIRRSAAPTRIQKTVSDHESFFKTKNIFFVFGGSKKENIYAIKGTGSEYSNSTRYDKDEEKPVEQNFQQLLSSLNMDKKKAKDKGKGKKGKQKKKEEDDKSDDKCSGASLMNLLETPDRKSMMLRECFCSPPIESVSPRKSRVRITGKIGLTNDDRYVMRCAATIDGKPVETNFPTFQDISLSSPPELDVQERNEIPRVCCPCSGEIFNQREKPTREFPRELSKVYQRDETVQANIQFDEPYRQTIACPAFTGTGPCPAFRNVETQCSPRNVNAVCFSNIEKLKIYSNKDQVVQCNCPNDSIINSKSIGVEADNNKTCNAPSCNSPLVIISVYPKQDSDEKYDEENSSINECNVRPPPKEKSNGKNGSRGNKKKGKESRSASPKPSKSPVKKEDKKAEKTQGKGEKQMKGKKGAKKEKMVKKEKPEGDEKVKTSGSAEKSPNGAQFGIALSRCQECCMTCMGSRAAQLNTKRMMNWVSAKKDVSNVSINIEGENELYDVLLRQGGLSTDLHVRQTLKNAKGMKGHTDPGSLHNFYPVPDNTRKYSNRSLSQTLLHDQPNADKTETMGPSVPRLNVRDSIEISHRREEKQSSNSVTFSTSASHSPSESKLAHLKHFKGDNCNLFNPVERDKEIRGLLGIEKTKPSTSKNYKEFATRAEADCKCSLCCFYRRQRERNVRSLRKTPDPSKFYTFMETQASDYDVEYFEDELNHKNYDNHNGEVDYKDYDNDANYKMCRNSQLVIEHQRECSPTFFGCELGDTVNKKVLYCTSGSDSAKKRHIYYYAPERPSSNARRSTEQTHYKKYLCVPKDPDSDPCGVMVTCPHRKRSSNEPEPEPEPEPELEPESEREYDEICCSEEEKITRETEHEEAPMSSPFIMNRNINIYLQIEQFCKQKPIILSHKQYNKVKKIIESAAAKDASKVNCICKRLSSKSNTIKDDIQAKKFFPWNRKSKKSKSDSVESVVSGEDSLKTENETKCDKNCHKFVLQHLVEDSPNEERKNSKSLNEDAGQYEEKRYKNSKIEKIDTGFAENGKKHSRKTKPQTVFNQERDKDHIKASKKTKCSIKPLSIDDDGEKWDREKKKSSKRKTGLGGGDESLERLKSGEERKGSSKEHKRSKFKEKSRESNENPRASGQNNILLETRTDVSQEQFCKRCGRPKKPISGTRFRQNTDYFSTCLCYEYKEKKGEPSVKNIYLNKFARTKRYAASSTEVRYTSVIYENYKHVTFSSTNIANEIVKPSITNLVTKNYNSTSLHTIFKGRRRAPTPNLGTSAYSLYSEYSDVTPVIKVDRPARTLQERKPFLRRLMSCLVMRSKTSGVKIDNVKRRPKISSIDTSVDSYHINTSLGEIELSSSIYDTSASFYSNHSVQPINSKIIKRGFLSSMRGFLANKKTPF